MTQEALKLALEAFHQIFNTTPVYHNNGTCIINDKSVELSNKATAAIKEALAQPEQDIAALVTGMEVSIDVSTGDHDSTHRLFGVVDLVQENQGSKHGLILLVQEPKANFKEALAQLEQWGSSAVTHPEYVAEQKRKTEELRSMLTQPEQEPVGDDWTPCMKLPVVVYVRKQRLGESHVSTREGITPVKPDDLIMSGVSGEEYPIGRAIFEQTYSLNTALPQRTWAGLTEERIKEIWLNGKDHGDDWTDVLALARSFEAELKGLNT